MALRMDSDERLLHELLSAEDADLTMFNLELVREALGTGGWIPVGDELLRVISPSASCFVHTPPAEEEPEETVCPKGINAFDYLEGLFHELQSTSHEVSEALRTAGESFEELPAGPITAPWDLDAMLSFSLIDEMIDATREEPPVPLVLHASSPPSTPGGAHA